MSIENEYANFRKNITCVEQVKKASNIDAAIHIRTMIAYNDVKIPKTSDTIAYYFLYKCLAYVSHASTSRINIRLIAEKAMCDYEQRYARLEYDARHEEQKARTLLNSCMGEEFHGSRFKTNERISHLVESISTNEPTLYALIKMTDEEIKANIDVQQMVVIRTYIRQMHDMLIGLYNDVVSIKKIKSKASEVSVEEVYANYLEFLKRG